ncbi:MAG: tyrosine-protein kinase Etk/Wzc [Paraglaciecola sp.]|jgi:tyrosine-protein kinase Etk/Wzc
MENKDNLLDVIRTLFRYKKHLIYTVGLVGIGAVIISLMLPVYYESITKFYPASEDLAMPESIFGRSTSKMHYYGSDEDSDRILTIAESGELAIFLIDSFNLNEVYEIDTTDVRAPYFVMEEFTSVYNVKQTKENAIEISMEDQDPERAAAIVNAAYYKINEIGQRLIKGSQQQTMNTLDEAFQKRNQTLSVIEDSLRVMRARYGIFNIETQGEMMANNIANIESRLISDSARLEVYLQRNNRDSIRSIQVKLAGANKQLSSLTTRLDKYSQGLGDVSMLIKQQEIAINQEGVEREQYNRINSARNSSFPTTLLLERGEVPVIKSRPKRALLVIAVVMIAFILTVFGVLIFDNYKDVDWKGIVEGK